MRETKHRILQVLLMQDKKLAAELGAAVWAAFHEIERLFNTGETRAHFDRVFIGQEIPKGVSELAALPGDRTSKVLKILKDPSMTDSGGRYRHRKLAQAVCTALGSKKGHSSIYIVTDQEIVPPKNWRYVIWDSFARGAVVSLAPIDPRYWGDFDINHVRLVKERIRAACCSITGQFLGLQRCYNSRCFLYARVDSVTNLDSMVHIGKEHKIPSLRHATFEERDAPEEIESVSSTPESDFSPEELESEEPLA